MRIAVAPRSSAVATFTILKLVSLVTPLRVPEDHESMGLDLAIHGESAYGFLTAADAYGEIEAAASSHHALAKEALAEAS